MPEMERTRQRERERPAAFIHIPTREYVASEMTQTEVAPDYKQPA